MGRAVLALLLAQCRYDGAARGGERHRCNKMIRIKQRSLGQRLTTCGFDLDCLAWAELPMLAVSGLGGAGFIHLFKFDLSGCTCGERHRVAT